MRLNEGSLVVDEKRRERYLTRGGGDEFLEMN